MEKQVIKFTPEKLKHLEFVQNIIDRMIRNAFLLKGWCLTILFALMSFSKNTSNHSKSFLYVVVFSFFFLSFYYILQEQLFINLYNFIRKKEETDFSMRIKITKKSFKDSILSFPNTIFFIFLFAVIYLMSF